MAVVDIVVTIVSKFLCEDRFNLLKKIRQNKNVFIIMCVVGIVLCIFLS